MTRVFELTDNGWFVVIGGVKVYLAAPGDPMSTWDLMKRADVAETAIRAHEATKGSPAKETP